MNTKIPVITLMPISAHVLKTIPADMLMIIPAHVLMTIPAYVLIMIPAEELMTIPAQKLMMIHYKLKLVTCNYLQLARNTMLIMMIIHCVKWFTDQHMCHTMKMARKYCCRKQQIHHKRQSETII